MHVDCKPICNVIAGPSPWWRPSKVSKKASCFQNIKENFLPAIHPHITLNKCKMQQIFFEQTTCSSQEMFCTDNRF